MFEFCFEIAQSKFWWIKSKIASILVVCLTSHNSPHLWV